LLTPLLIFVLTYFVLAIGRLPGLRIDRTGAAIVGAALMIGCNVLTIEQAYAAIDHDTIVLLFGMMIHVCSLHSSLLFGGTPPTANRVRNRSLPLVENGM
jgi:Na+/H+ antiporter NhaD/arsenite permease-like protein